MTRSSNGVAAPGPHHEEPGAVARNRRTQRDAILREREIKKVGAHI